MLWLHSLPASLPICPASVIMRMQSPPDFETFGVGWSNNLVLSWSACTGRICQRKTKAATNAQRCHRLFLRLSALLTAGCCSRGMPVCVTAACQLMPSVYFSLSSGSESSSHEKSAMKDHRRPPVTIEGLWSSLFWHQHMCACGIVGKMSRQRQPPRRH